MFVTLLLYGPHCVGRTSVFDLVNRHENSSYVYMVDYIEWCRPSRLTTSSHPL